MVGPFTVDVAAGPIAGAVSMFVELSQEGVEHGLGVQKSFPGDFAFHSRENDVESAWLKSLGKLFSAR